MPRCPIVSPGTVRLLFVDVRRQLLRDLEATGKATPDELADAHAAVAGAEVYGDWIEVRRELNTEQHRKMYTDTYKESGIGEGLQRDLNQLGMSRVMAYVLGWSYVEEDGRPMPFSEDAVNGVDYAAWQDILAAVDLHHARTEEALEARKNGQGDASKLSETSPSLVGSTGPMSTSVS